MRDACDSIFIISITSAILIGCMLLGGFLKEEKIMQRAIKLGIATELGGIYLFNKEIEQVKPKETPDGR